MASELPTPTELATIGQQKLRSQLDPNGTGAVDLHAGSRNDTYISVVGAASSRLAMHVSDRVAARSVSTATGDDLYTIAADLYQDAPKQANAATGYIYLIRSGTSATVIPNGTRFAVPATSSTPGVVFIASQDVPVGSSVLATTVPVVCVQNGLVGNVQTSSITAIMDPLTDTTWAIGTAPAGTTNVTSSMAGGAEVETDPQLQARLQQSAFDDSKKRGTKKAIFTGATRVAGVLYATVIEPLDGSVRVYVGDASYGLSSQLQTAVQTNLEDWRAFGIPALVLPYNVQTITANVNLYMSRPLSNYNVPIIQAQAVTNIMNYFTNRQRPDEVFGNAVISAAVAAHAEAQTATLTMSSSGSTQPDSSNNIHRQSDASAPATLNRFIVSNASIQVSVFPPQ